MALDTNIALGVRPIEQPNMLAQMAQAMQIRQANEEYESSNALKDFYAQGGDLNKPEDQRRLMSTVGAKGADLIAKQAAFQKTKEEVKQLGYKNVESAFAQSRELLSSIDPNSPNAGAQLIAWHEANHKNPVLGAVLATSGIDPTSSRATLEAAIAKGPAGIQEAIRRSSMGQAKYQQELMQTERSVQTANIGAGPAYARLAYDKANPTQHFFTREDGTLMGTSTRGGGAAAPVPMAGSAPSEPAPQISIGGGGGAAPMGAGSSIMNPASVNALAPSAPINQNALITQAQPTAAPNAPTYAKVRAAPVTKDIVDPTDPSGRRMITVDANTYKAGTGLGVDGKQMAPAGVLGVATSQIPANYMPDPNNPQGVIPVPGSPTDPNAAVPSGYRKTAKGFEFIPGGPADPAVQAQQTTGKLDAKTIATREAAYPQATLAVKNGEQNTERLIKEVNALHDHKGLSGITGFFGGRTTNFTGDARSAQADLKKITAEGTLKVLTDLRAASKTGGALGNTSNKDIELLQNAAAALDQTQNTEDFKRKLKDFAFVLERTKQNMREAYDMTYEYKTPATSGTPPPAPSTGIIDFGSLK
jgi:hypothetical protein